MSNALKPLPASWETDQEVALYGPDLSGEIGELNRLISQMARILEAQESRIRDLETRQKRFTVTHEEVKQITAMIRRRAEIYGEKYGLTDKASIAAFRGAIKKAILQENGIRDLHDLPECESERAKRLIDNWTSIRMVMDRRSKAARNGPP